MNNDVPFARAYVKTRNISIFSRSSGISDTVSPSSSDPNFVLCTQLKMLRSCFKSREKETNSILSIHMYKAREISLAYMRMGVEFSLSLEIRYTRLDDGKYFVTIILCLREATDSFYLYVLSVVGEKR